MQKLELSIRDRILLPSFLPQTGGLVTMQLVKDLTRKAAITLAEIDAYSIRDVPNGGTAWDTSKEQPIRIEVSDQQIELLKQGIQKADENQQIHVYMLELIEKIQGE